MKLEHFFLHLSPGLLLAAAVLPSAAAATACQCASDVAAETSSSALHLKLAAIATILVSGAIGVCLPIIGRSVPALGPDKPLFFLIKAFAAGVILCTGLVHILPDAFSSLSSPCIKEKPWGAFPLSGFVVMMAAIGTMMVDAFATGYYKRAHFNKAQPALDSDEERAAGEHVGHVHVHTHGEHGHSHGSINGDHMGMSTELIRNRIISQVLELGIVVHSVIIGISLGASKNPSIIKPLVAALSFHQFFEGMGLGSCIVQAQFRAQSMMVMALFFCLTTPLGVAIGIALSTGYDGNSTASLVIEGVFNSASAGILIYMALVDLLAADQMNPKMQGSWKLQLWANASLLMGAGCMSLLAKWA